MLSVGISGVRHVYRKRQIPQWRPAELFDKFLQDEGYRLAVNGTLGRLETMEFGGMGGMALPHPDEGGAHLCRRWIPRPPGDGWEYRRVKAKNNADE